MSKIFEIKVHDNPIIDFNISKNNSTIIIYYKDKTIILYDVDKKGIINKFSTIWDLSSIKIIGDNYYIVGELLTG